VELYLSPTVLPIGIFFEGWTTNDFSALGSVATAVATALLLVATVLIVVVARGQLRDARATRRAEAQAYVVIDIRPSASRMNILNLVIENLGSTIAMEVIFKFTPILNTGRPDYSLADSVLFRKGIPMLPPGRRIEFLFASAVELFNTPQAPRIYTVEVTFKDVWGERHIMTYTIDLTVLEDLQYVQELGIHQAAKALETIADVVKSVRSGGRLRVAARDDDAHEVEREVYEDLIGEGLYLGSRQLSPIVMALGRNVLVRTGVRRFRNALTARRKVNNSGS
jgi:hypothetical protein